MVKISEQNRVTLMSCSWFLERAIERLGRVDDGIVRMTMGVEQGREVSLQALARAMDQLDMLRSTLLKVTLFRQVSE